MGSGIKVMRSNIKGGLESQVMELGISFSVRSQSSGEFGF